eukprot:gnl/TRDRNA2_/TRDRNA2_91821_c0_seq1.p1 gnl/TRDRNA2_/TRDRNA2_91821_c0~~gnl/TRDRNA2_/TRDRNA2_91821_c0_seq1.p1  ORF type:complete len:329 (+),score=17.02 gnl/TRDRNA2_/TRDRNA2_91821_c0_seq1:32-1018(+)
MLRVLLSTCCFDSWEAYAADEPRPWAVSVADAKAPPASALSVIHDGSDIIGRSAVMYSQYSDTEVSATLQRGIWYSRNHSFAFCNLYSDLPGLTYVDVGANIGSLSVPMALCLEPGDGWVVAVEALPRHIELLRANFRANFVENALVFPYAVAQSTNQFQFLRLGTHPTNPGLSSVLLSDLRAHETVVPVTSLDAIYQSYPEVMSRVLVMKIDVEGFEGHAVLGAEKLLQEAPPCLLQMEFRKRWLELAGTPIAQILTYLESRGYSTADAKGFTFNSPDVFLWQDNFAECISQRSGYTVETVRQAIAKPRTVSDDISYRWLMVNWPSI